METHAHLQLKRLAIQFLRQRGCQAVATEVRCPISRYRVDVAGYLDSAPYEQRIEGSRTRQEPRTIVIECKQSREDFLRDREHTGSLLELRQRLERIRNSIQEHRIKQLEPQLRCSGTSLFAELEQWDFASSRLPSYRAVMRRLERIDEKLHGETKFFHVSRYCLADQLYVAAPHGMIRPREIPPGWGLLVCAPEHLLEESRAMDARADSFEVEVQAPPHASKPAHRMRLLRNIAVAASWAAQRRLMQPQMNTDEFNERDNKP